MKHETGRGAVTSECLINAGVTNVTTLTNTEFANSLV